MNSTHTRLLVVLFVESGRAIGKLGNCRVASRRVVGSARLRKEEVISERTGNCSLIEEKLKF